MDTRKIRNTMNYKSMKYLAASTFMFIGTSLLQKANLRFSDNSIYITRIAIVFGMMGLLANYYLTPNRESIAEDNDRPKPIDYLAWKKILKDEKKPAAMMDMRSFDYNIKQLKMLIEPSGKTLRVATKSIRIPTLIKHVLDQGAPFKGVMCYSAEEASLLYHEQKIDDLMIAYATTQVSDFKILRSLHGAGAEVCLVINSIHHMRLLSEYMTGLEKPFPVIIELDVPLTLFWGYLQLGARRSPIRTIADLKNLLEKSREYPLLRVRGIMAYEAIVAGVADASPFNQLLNPIAFVIRRLAANQIATLRAEVPLLFKSLNMPLEIFNGGGTGSINWAVKESALTEVSAGSALPHPHSFDYYSNLQGSFQFHPAVFFALPVGGTSDPTPNHSTKYPIIVCNGGGFIGSGVPGLDKLPIPVSPPYLRLSESEGAGEATTPLIVNMSEEKSIKEKKPIEEKARQETFYKNMPSFVVFRPAKSGELAERFNEFILVEGEQVIGHAPTYRGMGLS